MYWHYIAECRVGHEAGPYLAVLRAAAAARQHCQSDIRIQKCYRYILSPGIVHSCRYHRLNCALNHKFGGREINAGCVDKISVLSITKIITFIHKKTGQAYRSVSWEHPLHSHSSVLNNLKWSLHGFRLCQKYGNENWKRESERSAKGWELHNYD